MTEERIFTEEDFNTETARVGDLVAEAVVDNFMNCIPPVSYSAACSQMGEPHSQKQDEKTGAWRPTFLTFRRVWGEVWEYRGYCFRGETEERGREMAYV